VWTGHKGKAFSTNMRMNTAKGFTIELCQVYMHGFNTETI